MDADETEMGDEDLQNPAPHGDLVVIVANIVGFLVAVVTIFLGLLRRMNILAADCLSLQALWSCSSENSLYVILSVL
jgi:hypothetical protein